MKTIALFNSRSGVGKSFLAYHLAFMFQRLGARVVVADIDPQTHLTAALLDEERYEALSMGGPPKTILGAIEAASRSNSCPVPHVENIESIGLISGDVALAGLEDQFSQSWNDCLNKEPNEAIDALRITASFYSIAQKLSANQNVDVLLLDLGPALGAINRAALLAADAVIIPLAPDMASRRALRTLGKTFDHWRRQWNDRCHRRLATPFAIPAGILPIIGYVVVELDATAPLDLTRRANERAISHAFHESVLGDAIPADSDPSRLAWLRHLCGLLSLHIEARKPVFDLKAADGAIGSYAVAVKDAYAAFEKLAREISQRAGGVLPEEQD